LGLVVVGHAIQRPPSHTLGAFKLTSKQSFVQPDGNRIVQAEIKRIQLPDGSYTQMTSRFAEDGSRQSPVRMVGIVGRGVFTVDDEHHRLIFRSARNHAFQINEEALRKQPGYFGEDRILGYRVLIQRSTDVDEVVYLSPDLGIPLKILSYNPDGSYTAIEAENIEFGEGVSKEFEPIPGYAVDYSLYERQIADFEKQGRHDLASEMRKILEAQTRLHQ
jgi:hypothetical protein